jgi:L-lactate dehydrogenase complex protein LldG
MSRDNILKKIKTNKPATQSLPAIDIGKFSVSGDLLEDFIKNVVASAGNIFRVKNIEEITSKIRNLFPDAKEIISFVDGIDIGTIDPKTISSSKEIENLELAIINGQFGAAENGAVWVSDKNFSHRAIPFIASHLILVLNKENIVENMHEAMLNVAGFNEGYGVFISGPSKTADIEQSLVIGAQGPLSLTIFLLD